MRPLSWIAAVTALCLVILATPALAQQGSLTELDEVPSGRQGPDPYAAILAQELPPPETDIVVPDPLLEGPGQAKEFDLHMAVQRALEANPQILSVRETLTSADYLRRAAMGEFGFKINVGYDWTRVNDPTRSVAGGGTVTAVDQNQFNLSVTLTQPIFTGFRLLNQYQRAKLVKDQAEAQLRNAELTIIRAVQVTYLQLLNARLDVRSAEDAIKRLESNLKVSKAFYDVGLQPRLDVLQAEAELATAQQELLLAENQVKTRTAELNSLLGLPVNFPAKYTGELSYIPFAKTLDQCLNIAYANRPDLDIARKAVEIAQKDVKIAASDFYPTVNGNLSWSTYGDDPTVSGSDIVNQNFSSWAAGASLDWNVFEWGAATNTYRAAKKDVSALEASLADTRLNAEFQVKSNLLAVQDARDRIRQAKTGVVAAREGFRMSLARYRAQVGTITDVLDAQSRVTDAETQLSGAMADYQTALAELYNSIGLRSQSLDPAVVFAVQ